MVESTVCLLLDETVPDLSLSPEIKSIFDGLPDVFTLGMPGSTRQEK